MESPARMTGQPGPGVGVLVRAVIVENDMDFPVLWNLAFNLLEKAQKLLMSLALHVFRHHAAIQHIEGCKQGGCADAFIVMGEGLATAFLQWQPWLRTPSRACKHALPGNGQVPEFATFHQPKAPPHGPEGIHKGQPPRAVFSQIPGRLTA